MADGKFGLKLDISLKHGIRVDSNPEKSSGANTVLYAFKQVDSGKRKADDMEESDSEVCKSRVITHLFTNT